MTFTIIESNSEVSRRGEFVHIRASIQGVARLEKDKEFINIQLFSIS